MKIFCLVVVLGVLASLTACTSTATEEVSGQEYYSALAYLTVSLPDGWAAVEGPEALVLTRHLKGQVAFNSWGEEAFWAHAVQTGTSSYAYGPQGVMSQVPEGGAYVALVCNDGQPPPSGYNPPEYTPADLGELLELHDWRQDSATEAQFLQFYKWGRDLHIEIACHPDASDRTLAELNALLASWQFDAVPEGDAEWLGRQARALLPEAVKPFMFNNRAGSIGDDGINRITEVETEGTVTVFRFIYQWDSLSHWWTVAVTPHGETTLTGEGGDPLRF